MIDFNGPQFEDTADLDKMSDAELAKYFTEQIMQKLVKDHVINYNDCYDHIYKIALNAKCALIFRKPK